MVVFNFDFAIEDLTWFRRFRCTKIVFDKFIKCRGLSVIIHAPLLFSEVFRAQINALTAYMFLLDKCPVLTIANREDRRV